MGALVMALNAPGHLSLDSVVALAEGRSGQRITWGPPMYSAIVGAFDRIYPGTTLYMLASVSLLAAAWAILPALRPRLWWGALIVLLAALATPQISIYQGIIWKDVLFANLTVAAFVTLAVAGRTWTSKPARFAAFAVACVLLAMACLVRQNGFVAVAAAGVVLAWIAGSFGGRRSAFAWGVAGIAVPLLLMIGLDAVTPVREAPGVASKDRGVRLVQHYDLAAALAEDPSRPLPVLDRANPAEMPVFRAEARKAYSPVRSDLLGRSEPLSKIIWRLDADAVADQWIDLIVTDPIGYGTRRLAIFEWVFAAPVVDYCLPVHLGVSGPPDLMAKLKLEPRVSHQDRRLYNYMTWFLDTPAMSHVAYAVIALVVGLLLLLRRDPADIAIAGLMGAALAFAGSFFVISLACDYRYLYLLDLAAISGLLYLAIDPRLRRRA